MVGVVAPPSGGGWEQQDGTMRGLKVPGFSSVLKLFHYLIDMLAKSRARSRLPGRVRVGGGIILIRSRMQNLTGDLLMITNQPPRDHGPSSMLKNLAQAWGGFKKPPLIQFLFY